METRKWTIATHDPPSSQLVREEPANVHHALVQNLNFIKLKFEIRQVRVTATRLKNQLLALFFATIFRLRHLTRQTDTHTHTLMQDHPLLVHVPFSKFEHRKSLIIASQRLLVI